MDVNLTYKLKQELPGILNIILSHYKTISDNHKIFMSKESIAEAAEFRSEADVVEEWLSVGTVKLISYEEKIDILDMFAAYMDFATLRGMKQITIRKFGRDLKRVLGHEYDARYYRSNGRTGYKGLALVGKKENF